MAAPGVGLRFALASLATWRVTHLLAEEDGPFDAVVRLRARAGAGQFGELMDCFYCLSVWVAAPATLAVARRPRDLPLAWLALSGAACLLERATGAAEPVEEGAPDVLWPEAQGDQHDQASRHDPGGSTAAARSAAGSADDVRQRAVTQG